MDDITIQDHRLTRALDELRWVNRLLGGYSSVVQVLSGYLNRRGSLHRVNVLDIGTGVGDFPEYIVDWAHRRGIEMHVTGIDFNPATVAHANRVLDRRMKEHLRTHVDIRQGDAERLEFEDGSYDVVVASMFLHHFDSPRCSDLLARFNRIARDGIIINDLHRHPMAYYGIKSLAQLLQASPMFAHDGPLSVRRGFKFDDLENIARQGGLKEYRIYWHWAFRWVLTTL